jgi:hypothetical protein
MNATKPSFTIDTYSDRQYPYFYWIWDFITSFSEVLQCLSSCYRCIQPLTSHPLAYMYTFQLFWSLLFMRLKFSTRFSSKPFSYLSCPFYLGLCTMLMQGTKYRFWISSLFFSCFLAWISKYSLEHFVLRLTLGQMPSVQKIHLNLIHCLTARWRLVMCRKLHFIFLPSFRGFGELSKTPKSNI